MVLGKSGRFIGQWVPESDCEIETNKAGVAARICCHFLMLQVFFNVFAFKTMHNSSPGCTQLLKQPELDSEHGRKEFYGFMFSISIENNVRGRAEGSSD